MRLVPATKNGQCLMRLFPIICVLVVGASGSCVRAHDGHEHGEPVPAVDEQRLHAPTAMPDRILLSWKEDPAHTQAITWRTDTSVHRAYAELALAADGPLFVVDAKRFPATTTPHKGDLGPAHYHAVNLTGLTARGFTFARPKREPSRSRSSTSGMRKTTSSRIGRASSGRRLPTLRGRRSCCTRGTW
jgi:hypothetical protein